MYKEVALIGSAKHPVLLSNSSASATESRCINREFPRLVDQRGTGCASNSSQIRSGIAVLHELVLNGQWSILVLAGREMASFLVNQRSPT